jgi:hypothetical protein
MPKREKSYHGTLGGYKRLRSVKTLGSEAMFFLLELVGDRSRTLHRSNGIKFARQRYSDAQVNVIPCRARASTRALASFRHVPELLRLRNSSRAYSPCVHAG